METIKIQNVIGDKGTGYIEGKKIFQILDALLSKGQTVMVDMSGLIFTSSSFYNAAIGELILKYDIKFLKDRINFVNLSNKDKFLLSKSISFAKRVKAEHNVSSSNLTQASI